MGDDVAVADVREWAAGLDEITALIGPRFSRSEPRENAVAYLRGLLSGRERKNSWTISEHAGESVPAPIQRLLSTTDWDPDLVRDDLRSYVASHLGDPGGILIVDETGFLKKGDRSAGVARQCDHAAGSAIHPLTQGAKRWGTECDCARIWMDAHAVLPYAASTNRVD